MTYGWLTGSPHSWAGGLVGGAPHDLWTAGANTTYLELFDGASGNLVDKVHSTGMTAVNASTYRVPGTGVWANFTGITTSASSYFATATASSYFDLGASGTGSCTIELLLKTTDQDATLLDCESKTSPYYGWVIYGDHAANETWIYAVCDDGTVVDQLLGDWDSWADGNIHKVRFVRDSVAGKMSMFVDGSLRGTPATIPAKAITGRVRAIGGTSAGQYLLQGTFYGYKITNDATTVSSGG